MKYRVGDTGKIGCVIHAVAPDGDLHVTISTRNSTTFRICIEAKELLDHTPRTIQVGDYVTKPDNDAKFKVIAIDGGTAWVRGPFGPDELVKRRILTPVSPPC